VERRQFRFTRIEIDATVDGDAIFIEDAHDSIPKRRFNELPDHLQLRRAPPENATPPSSNCPNQRREMGTESPMAKLSGEMDRGVGTCQFSLET